MTAIQFPSNPTNGQTYTVGSTSYSYNATYGAWDASAAGGSGTQTYATIAELPLTDNTTGAQAFVSENNRLYIWSGTGWYNIALVNTSPTAITGASGSYSFATDGTPIVITLVSTDPEGIPITWSYAVTGGSLENGGGTTATVSQVANVFTITPSTNENYVGEFSLTFTASDGVNLATATSSFSLMFAILNSRYTTLMLKAESSGLNTTFVDSSTNNFTITRNGDVTQGTFSPYGDNWSNYFGGVSGNYLSTTSAESSVNFGTNDFTVEFWLNANSTAGNNFILDARSSGSQNNLCILITSGYWLWQYAGSNVIYTNSNMITVGTWNHVAFVRLGSTLSLYVNGVLVTTASDSTNYAAAAAAGRPGIGGGGFTTDMIFNGAISNLRIVKGTAIYTTAFTPATEPLTAVAGTSLLTCQSNRFKDNSTNNFAITRNGDVKVTAFGPYDQIAYNPAVNGGSSTHSGTNYLSYTEQAIGTSTDFCWELFIYPTGNAGGQTRLFGANSNDPLVYVYGAAVNGSFTNWYIYFADSLIMSGTLSILMHTWNHIAVTRSSGTLRFFLNGVLLNSISNSSSFPSKTWWVGSHPTSNSGLIGHISNYRTIIGSAVYTANFSPPTAPLTAVAGTSLLLKCTNGNIVDYSGNSNLSVIGNTAVNTTTTKYAAGSVYFDGNGDYLTASPGPNFAYGTGNFTIEAWVYPQSFASEPMIWSQTADGQNYFLLYITSGGTPSFRFGSGGGTGITSSVAISLNAWSHVSVVREGTGTNQLKVYVNGVQTAVGTCAWDFTNTTYIPTIGRYTHSASLHFTGYIEDVRVTKGLARYTADFTPPTSELLG